MKSPFVALAVLLLAPLTRAEVTENFSRSYPLSAGGTISLSNINGSVEVSVWDKNEVSLEAVKTARDSAGLARIEIAVDVMNSDVSATGVHGNVRIETMNGHIMAEGLNADADLRTMNGRIDASFDSLGKRQRVRLNTMNGACTVSLPARSSADLNASSMNGRISCEPPITTEKSSRHSLRGDLGDGSATLTLHSMNGSLTIKNRP